MQQFNDTPFVGRFIYIINNKFQVKGNFILKKKIFLDFFELSEISSYPTLLWTEFYRKPSRLGAPLVYGHRYGNW